MTTTDSRTDFWYICLFQKTTKNKKEIIFSRLLKMSIIRFPAHRHRNDLSRHFFFFHSIVSQIIFIHSHDLNSRMPQTQIKIIIVRFFFTHSMTMMRVLDTRQIYFLFNSNTGCSFIAFIFLSLFPYRTIQACLANFALFLLLYQLLLVFFFISLQIVFFFWSLTFPVQVLQKMCSLCKFNEICFSQTADCLSFVKMIV